MLIRNLARKRHRANAVLTVDDVFKSYVRTGTSAEQTITTNIDMTQGYMVWSKSRFTDTDHAIYDSVRGITKDLVTNSTEIETTQLEGLKSVSSTGHTWGTLSKINTLNDTYVDWIYRVAPKFLDIVEYDGNNSTQTINHSLNTEVGWLIIKKISLTNSFWTTWHRSLLFGYRIALEQSNNAVNSASVNFFGNNSTYINPTATNFTVGSNSNVNQSGARYITYIFAHDTSADGLIQCGSFTTDGDGNGTINHGWTEGVQYMMIKASSTTGDWEIYDTARTPAFSGNDTRLRANLSNAEDSVTRVSASGTTLSLTGLSASQTYIYKIIRAAS